MEKYNEKDVLRLAKRWNNPKRNYLLVNPLQAKHIPVPPEKALKMMNSIGCLLREAAPSASLIIGFAETATAIGAAAAMEFQDSVYYIHTTREYCKNSTLKFYEEHSHAMEQQLVSDTLKNMNHNKIILIDDEISTGKTIENIIYALKNAFPNLKNTEFIIGSVINRLTQERINSLAEKSIRFISLVSIENKSYDEEVSKFSIETPQKVLTPNKYNYYSFAPSNKIPDLRNGCNVRSMKSKLSDFSEESFRYLAPHISNYKKILVLGTEECMISAICLGVKIEKELKNVSVYTHATTRSPIGISSNEDYPCKNGFSIESFYEKDRVTYLYNVKSYDAVIVVTDSDDNSQCELAMNCLCSLFSEYSKEIYLIRG